MTARGGSSADGWLLAACAFLAALAVAPVLRAQDRARAAVRPPLPYVLRGFRPCEDCGTGFEVRACAPVMIRRSDRADARVDYRLGRGESAWMDDGNVRVLEPGRVVVRRALTNVSLDSAERFGAGDTVYTFAAEGLGEWRAWTHGHAWHGRQFWVDPGWAAQHAPGAADTAIAVVVSDPVRELWWKLRIGSHGSPRTGWAKLDHNLTTPLDSSCATPHES